MRIKALFKIIRADEGERKKRVGLLKETASLEWKMDE
jgi:hypothetical protein